jgi:Protein of unknown function DUF262
MIRYQIRSVSLLSVVNDIRRKRWVPDAYFQRNLVWREIHKRDFIDTILKGYPFPQLFISRGEIDLERMETTSLIVDGQQRTNAIMEFVDNKFSCGGRFFNQLTDDEKSEFFKYEIGIIELDLSNRSAEVKEIFQRLNRTSNSLTTIEKLASEFGASEYMLVAKLLTDQLDLPEDQEDSEYKVDPLIPLTFFAWAKSQNSGKYNEYLRKSETFTSHETARKVPLFYTLNIISTVLTGYFNRNDQTLELLETYKEEFDEKDRILRTFDETTEALEGLGLVKGSMWFQKANFFTLFAEIASRIYSSGKINPLVLADKLRNFESSLPTDYSFAAREAVNNKKERALRGHYISALIADSAP